MGHPALDRILKQIDKHKDELIESTNLMGELAEEYEREQPKEEEPIENVTEVFSEEALKVREEALKEIEKETEEIEQEAEERREGIRKQVEATDGSGDPATLPPPEIKPTDQVVTLPEDVQEYLDSEKEEYSFDSCFDLRDFITQNRDKFEEWAHPALDSVLSAVNSITSGCKCNLEKRRVMVEDYYVKFVTQNQHNSLMDKMKEILKTKKIKFYSHDDLFLEV